MLTLDVITRIRANCPGFAYVDHALTSASDTPLPSAMVVPSKIEALPDGLIGPVHSQDITQFFSIFILLARRQDGVVGAGGADDLDTLTAQLRATLPGWQLDAYHAPMNFAGGALDRYSTGVACWREDYAVVTEIRL